MPEITAIILAAGDGKRMRSDLPKVLHPVCGAPMIDYCVQAAQKSGIQKTLVVTRKNNKLLDLHLKKFPKIKIIHQTTPLGTGHAVLACRSALNGYHGTVLIFYGDAPLLHTKTIKNLVARVEESEATLGFITTRFQNPQGCGRVLRNGTGDVARIVEEREASPEEKGIHEVNVGVYAVKSDWLFATLEKLKAHPKTGEYYLTDIVGEAVSEGEKLVGILEESSQQFFSVNSRDQLNIVEECMRSTLIQKWMDQGVTFVDGRHVYIDSEVIIGADTTIHPQVYLHGKTRIGKKCVIECGAVLKDMIVGDGVHIKPYCVLEESVIEAEAQVGPFARLRPESVVGKGARIGNFVELKKTKMGPGSKANHLSYLGDAEIGSETNVGCGTITCNYDGIKKHPTKIGKKVFVGSDVQFVAPVKIGDGAYIGAGSTITEDVPAKALAIARGRQVNKKGWKRK